MNDNIDKEEELYVSMLNMIHEYMKNADSNIMEEEILYYVAKELDIVEKVKKYDLKRELYEMLAINISEEINYDFVEEEINNNLKDKEVYLNIKKIMIENLFSNKNENEDNIIKKH